MNLTPFHLSDLYVMLPELSLSVLAMALLMLGVMFKKTNPAPMICVLALFSLLFVFYLVTGDGPEHLSVAGDLFVSDAFTDFIKGLLLVGTVLVLILSSDWLDRPEHQQFEFSILIMLSLVGMMLMVSANNFMSMYMGVELAALAQYVLAAFRRDSLKSSEAGLKYFVLGALASGMMLFGMSLVYGFAGTTGFTGIATLLSAANGVASGGLVIGLVLIMVGLCFKVSAVPFHMWTPDVYEGAPTPVTAFFAIAPKVAGLALFTRVLMQPFGDLTASWQQIIIFAAVASMIVGAFGALTQTNFKRLLAYSSIGHVGYALVGLAAGTTAGVQAILIYLTLYVVMSAGAFGCILLMKRHGEYVEDIEELSGLSKTHPKIAFLIAVLMFSMAGIPPLAGFFGKLYVFLAAVEQGLIVLAVVGVLSSVVACYYYLKVVKLMYFDDAREPFDREMSISTRITLIFCGAFTLLFFVHPTPLITFTQKAAEALAW